MFISSLQPTVVRLACLPERQCLSLYMPLVAGKQAGERNSGRLKGLLGTALDRLLELGASWRDAARHDLCDTRGRRRARNLAGGPRVVWLCLPARHTWS